MATTLAQNAEHDGAALRITDRIRSSLDLSAVLQYAVDELGMATGVSRSLIQLNPGHDEASLLVEWDRGDTLPLGVQPPTVVARRVFDTFEPVVIESIEEADENVRAYLASVGSQAAIAIPVRWRDRVLAALGFQDSRPRSWREEVLPLLERLEGQLGAALAQAALYKQQQETLEQMRNLDRMREELLANVSHELRTPLTAIIGSIKTLRRRDESLSLEDRALLLGVMEEQAERLFHLTEDVLQLSRLTRGQRTLHRAPVRVSELVDRARTGLELPEGRELAVQLDGDPTVHVDPNRLVQVLVNLLQNAVRHGAGRIDLRCAREGPNALISVADEGRGVDPSYREEMFEPFSHGSDRSDSTGLGLSIARAIVEAHGGTLRYEAGAGAGPHRFAVSLPAASGPPGALASDGMRGRTRSFDGV